jgi:hypothetical protein
MRGIWASTGLCAALLAAGPAFGHAKFLGSDPAADARLAQPPASLTLRFNEAVRLALLTLKTAGHDVPVSIDRAAAPTSSVTVPLPPLAPGRYAVHWSVLTADDGHAVSGDYLFVIGPPG